MYDSNERVTGPVKAAIDLIGNYPKKPSQKELVSALQWHFRKSPVGALREAYEAGIIPASWSQVRCIMSTHQQPHCKVHEPHEHQLTVAPDAATCIFIIIEI